MSLRVTSQFSQVTLITLEPGPKTVAVPQCWLWHLVRVNIKFKGLILNVFKQKTLCEDVVHQTPPVAAGWANMHCAFWKGLQTEQFSVEKSPYLHHSKQKNTKLFFIPHQAGETKYFSLFYLISISKSVTKTNLDDKSPTRFTHQPLWLSTLASIFPAHLKDVAVLHSKQMPHRWVS